MILLNVGSKYVSMELSERHESILGHPLIRRLFIFAVVFTATRDLWISILLTAAFIVLVTGLHDDSQFCLIPKRYRVFKDEKKSQQQQIRESDVQQAKEILKKYQQQEAQKKGKKTLGGGRGSTENSIRKQWEKQQQQRRNIYSYNMNLLQQRKNNTKVI